VAHDVSPAGARQLKNQPRTADVIDMGTASLTAALAALGLLVAGRAEADVIVLLRSGTELRATRTWEEGEMVNLQLETGVVGFPADAIKSIREVEADDADQALEPSRGEDAAGDVGTGSGDGETVHGEPAAQPTPAPPPMVVDERVPEVRGEDSQTKMARLNALSFKTYREISVARTQGQPPETIEKLQRKIDEITRQRAATLKRLQAIH